MIQRVYLEDLEETKTRGWGVSLIRLIVAAEHRVPVIANDLLAAVGGGTSGLTRIQAIDLLETVLVYKLPNLTREEIRTMLHLPDTDLKETRFYREAFAEGEARGEAKGEVQGILKGKREGELMLVLRLLCRRLGVLPTPYEA